MEETEANQNQDENEKKKSDQGDKNGRREVTKGSGKHHHGIWRVWNG